ncbi:ABC transporter ATP-binding protein/permease [Haploplasma axanthum]|nr:ATP-binding cassette domain-containing protein [Haploplasma axanthum]
MNINNISKVFFENEPKEIKALKNISFEIINSGLVLISGESGSGKTTLLNIIAGIDSPTNGEIYPELNDRKGSFIFQDFQLFDDFSVYENMEIILGLKNINDSDLVYEALKKVNMEKFSESKINQLSGGQKQRVAIARAILLDFSILYCDEPTANLDKENKRAVAKILKKLSEDRLVLIVSHEENLWEDLYDQKLILEDGNIISNDIKSNNLVRVEKNNEEFKLKSSDAFKFSKKSIKKQKSKYITTLVLFILTLSTLILSMSISFNSNDISTYRTFASVDKPNLYYLEVDRVVEGMHELRSIPLNKTESYNKKYKSKMFYKPSRGYIDLGFEDITYNEILTTIIISDTYNGNIIENNSVVINDYIADKIIENSNYISYDEILGKEVILNNHKLNVEYIEQSKKIPNQEYQYEYDLFHRKQIYMNLSTFELIDNVNSKFFTANILKGEKETSIYIGKKTLEIDLNLGSTTNKNNEIIISEKYALENLVSDSSELAGLIGREITFEFFNKSYRQKNFDDYEKTKFVITGITRTSNYDVYFDSSVFDSFKNRFDNRKMINNFMRGIFIEEYDKNTISKLSKEGLYHNTFISTRIESTISSIKIISYIMYVVSGLFLIISLFLLLNVISTNMYGRKKEIGILQTIHVSLKQIFKIFIYDLAIIIVPAFLIAVIISSIEIHFFNLFLIKESISLIFWINYNLLAVICVVTICILISLLIILKTSNKLKRFTTVDVLYNR